jgi:hypothetical protein
MEKAGYRVEALDESDALEVVHGSEQTKPEKI